MACGVGLQPFLAWGRGVGMGMGAGLRSCSSMLVASPSHLADLGSPSLCAQQGGSRLITHAVLGLPLRNFDSVGMGWDVRLNIT